jgi:hypothetical protein
LAVSAAILAAGTLSALAESPRPEDPRPIPPVKAGLACWYDAAVGVTTDDKGVVQVWRDLSGNGHDGTLAAGAPRLAANQVNAKPAVQFRTASGPCGLTLERPFFVEQQYVVVRSPNAKWSNDGCFLGRRWRRASSYRLSRSTTRFWGDQYPIAVSKNGKKIAEQPFDLGVITEYMILKIDVNDGDMSNNTYQIGMADGASCDCDIAEILGFRTVLSPADEQRVGGYLAAKYGITAAYPAHSASDTSAPDGFGINKPPSSSHAGAMATVPSPKLTVTKGLVCWFDAAVGVVADDKGTVRTWEDLSGKAHHARTGGGTPPVFASRQIGPKPAVQFRKGWLALDGELFAKEHYLVLRSPGPKWSGAGGLLGRLKGRGSSYNTWGNDTGFWQDHHPAAVSRNGTVLPGPAFDCSPLKEFVILKIIVDALAEKEAAYAIGNNDGLAHCDFDVAEILGYQFLLSPKEEALVGGYLAAKYGIGTAYPPLPPPGAKPAELRPEETAAVKYQGWRHSGSLWLLTTPEGANLPATAAEEDFPVLVRLDKDWFRFAEAQANGEDIRFATEAGMPLAYQIDEWDAAAGTASIWIRVPVIHGNARQEIKMFWGKADARNASSGPAVFNRSNGYLSVWHMSDPVRDDAGTVESKDQGTASSGGMISGSRHFAGGKGIDCGGRIRTYPFASSPHTSEAWVKADRFNATILSWGKRDVISLRVTPTPAHFAVETGQARTHATGTAPKSQWVHVAYTYDGQNGRIYVNGQPDVPSPAPEPSAMEVLTPVRMQIGAGFLGDLDEVRISNLARSADWLKLQYANQIRLQTLVGHLVQPGSDFAVSEKAVSLLEGQSATVTARAAGAQKVYWLINRGGQETLAATDRLSFMIDAGRVAGDQSWALRFMAVYADGVKSLVIPVTIRESIPDPVFTVKAPSAWDGRERIEIVPQISNLGAMQTKGAGELKCDWTVPSIVEVKDILPGTLVLRRARNSGKLTVTVAVSNSGQPVVRAVQIAVKEPARDPWVQRIPEKDEKPEDGQFYARDDNNEGTLYYNGTLDEPANAVFLRIYADDKPFKTETQSLAADKSYAFAVKLKPGLVKYRVEFGTKTAGREKVLHAAGNLVCGDAYLIDGQSNALATDTGEESPRDTSEWIRSYGGLSGRGDATDWVRDRFTEARRAGLARPNLWCYPVWKMARPEHKAELGWWGMELAKRLVASQKVPIFIVNGAAGGTRIDEHQPTPANHADLKTIYGRMLWRVQQARLTHGIRAVLWHQGESDQGCDGPDGGYGWETYPRYFLEMSAAWKRDFPNIRHYYIYQIWPNSCGMGNGHGDMLREVQRTLPQHYSNMDILPTLGIKPPGPCHYPLAGWTEFARLVQPLIERDFYGKVPAASITAANLTRAYYANRAKDTIALEFDQPVVWKDELAGQFYLDDGAGQVGSGSVSGNLLTLRLKAASSAKTITYLHEMNWSQVKLLIGANGIAALTFCNVPIATAEEHVR